MKPATHRLAIFLASVALLSACNANTTVVQTDLRTQAGVYLVGYSTEPLARQDFENQLQSDLTSGGMLAYTSHTDIPDILQSDAEEVFAFAKQRNVVAIVIINQVKDSPMTDNSRIQAESPTVRTFFQNARSKKVAPNNTDVFAEVNAYAIDKDRDTATLVWSGVTATFRPAGRTEAIADLSATVATALRDAQDRLRSR